MIGLEFVAGMMTGGLLAFFVSISIRGPSMARGAGALCPGAPAEPIRDHPRSRGRGCKVSSRQMLSTVQQEVLSGLMHLGAPFRDAEAAVRAASDGHAGQGFDELFRLALALLRPPTHRKASAA
jgi:hypothetical protein